MSAQRKPRRVAVPVGPFGAHVFSTIRTDAVVECEGQHFMTVNTGEGARRLAAILNDAVALAKDVGTVGASVDAQRQKIGFAVASALGLKLDFSKEAGE